MLRRTESYAGKAQRNIAAPYPQKKLLSTVDEPEGSDGSLGSSGCDFVDHSNVRFKKLDDISAIKFKDYCGPTPESNWVIPGVLLVGAYPASQDDEETYELITSILKERITKFVCLQQEYRDEGVTVEMWRSGNALRPYFHDVRMVVHNKAMFPDLQGFSIVDREALSFVHFPIRDCGITDDERVLELSRTLVKAISEGEIIYLHCWGGHGRTGTLVCIMLHLMYSLDSVEAMSRCQLVHDLRMCPVVVGSPQTQTQRDQVTRVIRRLMTQTHFHRRTLSDLFNHTGAARLSMLMEHSPRSEAASHREAPSSPSISPFSPGALNSAMLYPASCTDDALYRSSSNDEDDEAEEVVTIGYSCLDDDDFTDPTPSEAAVPSSPPAVLAHRAIISVSATILSLSDSNADSYIDSDTHIAVGRSPTKALTGAVLSISSPQQEERVVSVFSPVSLAGRHLFEPNDKGAVDATAGSTGSEGMDVEVPAGAGDASIHGKNGICVEGGIGSVAMDCEGGKAAAVLSPPIVAPFGAKAGLDLPQWAPLVESTVPLSDSDKSMDVRSSSGTGVERVQHPVPVPPPASARPSTGSGSSASGVLAGLRNFRMQWGSGSGKYPQAASPLSGTSGGSPSTPEKEKERGALSLVPGTQLDLDALSR